MDHLILENLPDNEDLEIIPSEYWILNCFFIVLNDGEHKHLPLTYPIYKFDKRTGNIEGGLWTPPYVAERLEGRIKRLNTPKAIKKMISDYIKEREAVFANDVAYLLYYLGVQNYELERISEFTEYKTSFSEPTKVKCYHIINHLVTSIDKAGVTNLADPECMRNLHFMNLDIDLSALVNRKTERFPSYNGKVLASNLFKVLQENRNILLDESKHNRLYIDYLENNFQGVLFSYDINSSALIRDKIESNYASLLQSGFEISEEFISRILVIFTEVLAINNVHQYRLEGDGFVAAIPQRDFDMFALEDQSEAIKVILKISDQCDYQISQLLSNFNNNFSSKIAVCYGKYKYGKIGGIRAKTPTFSGKDMFILARLREGVACWNRENGNNNSCYGILSNDSALFIDKELVSKKVQIEIKESTLDIDIYRRC